MQILVLEVNSSITLFNLNEESGNLTFKKINEIESLLLEGNHIALISDAGTPLISDPGSELISYLVSKKNKIISIPGPSSILVALTISGFDLSEFQFLGFIPKAGKEKS